MTCTNFKTREQTTIPPEIGSIFPLPSQAVKASREEKRCLPDRVYFSLCREALFAVLASLGSLEKRACLPAYTCQTVIDPFEQLGWKCRFYDIREDLRIDEASFLGEVEAFAPSVIVVHPYFGMEYDVDELSFIEQAKSSGAVIIKDLTQCAFSVRREGVFDFFVGSLRKWLPIPDGAFLEVGSEGFEIGVPVEESKVFTTLQLDAMSLRRMYFKYGDERLKDVSRRLNKDAESLACGPISPHAISPYSLEVVETVDLAYAEQQRLKNYERLFRGLASSSACELVRKESESVTTAPLYFPVYFENRSKVIQALANRGVYVPVLWPVETDSLLISNSVRKIFGHLAAIPCDQRYGANDMDRIVEIVRELEEDVV